MSLGEYDKIELSDQNSCTNGARCPVTRGTTTHMLFDCSSVTAFWNRLAKIIHELLGTHTLQKRCEL
jgi:hypothetical protein